ncbi:hypothetical protein PIB30_082844 [Stylosanthes scabra]|uniref:Embryo defective 1703 n=1 Tax=Stylosanthes scabra TaxID=79078 RepID=A0ABU6ZQP5_9FABA|nr:hypothetical protein [Stylosanthes scabra]
MAVLNISTFSTFCNPKTLSNTKFPSKYSNKPTFHRTPLFSPHFFSSNTTKFQTFAQFRRPTNRRNYLRKKLLHDSHNQVSPNKLLTDPPPSEFHEKSSSFSNGVEDSVSEGNKVENFEVEKQQKSKFSLGGESVRLNKLENWVEQYKKDFESWGIGSGTIFTVYEDSNGGVKRVIVDEDEILRRNGVDREVIDEFPEVVYKISNAKNMAREMEKGNNVISRNSSVAKFVVQGEEVVAESGFVSSVRGFVAQPGLLPRISRVGSGVLCVMVVIWAVKKLFSIGGGELEYTGMEKEMMRRKIKARKEREVLVKGNVEVIPEPSESLTMDIKKPKLDKDQLKNTILKAKASADKLALQDSSSKLTSKTTDFDYKVQEIQDMARRARRIEAREKSQVGKDTERNGPVLEESSSEMEVVQKDGERNQDEVERKATQSNEILESASVDDTGVIDNSVVHGVIRDECNVHASKILVQGDTETDKQELEFTDNHVSAKDGEGNHRQPLAMPINGSTVTNESSMKKKPRIIRSVKEARDYLSKKHDKQDPDTVSTNFEHVKEDFDSRPSSNIDFNRRTLEMNGTMSRTDDLSEKFDSKPLINSGEDSDHADKEFGPTMNENFEHTTIESGGDLQKSETTLESEVDGASVDTTLTVKGEDQLEENFDEDECIINQTRSDYLNEISESKPAIFAGEDSDRNNKEFELVKDVYKDFGVELKEEEFRKSEITLDHKVNGGSAEKGVSAKKENWLLNNFHEVEPILKQIGEGFRDNYMVARERVDQPLDIPTEAESLGYEDSGELDWMQDDHLRDIVFRVRDNELSGRDPFYSMTAEDKEAFFRGLEKKVEKENKNLSHIHEWLHANIENLDYGAEKIIPRWKGPPVEKVAEFLNQFLEQRKANSTQNLSPVKKDENRSTKVSVHSSSKEKVDGSKVPSKKSKKPKTIIEGSDGSVKVGKKSGKEYWQHTKKWSQGFLDSYNAETDPEVKSTMKDIGKDLDRWITEKEIEEAADLMNRLPERNKSFMEKKLSKLKREMELFGPQAVVSKYREYADDKEEDYLWWLDLPYVLCIEMYTIDDGEERVGFYSLEMASDLELEPKPNHVIAFQNASDCKNFCYIIQAHLEMLGKGNAFVVARPPKDAFREAKANGFGVTVIKKGELQLNIDQPLEEVEEQITEIGSKMYHDMMLKDRSVDINSIMKGVFGFNESTTKRLKRRLKKPRKG